MTETEKAIADLFRKQDVHDTQIAELKEEVGAVEKAVMVCASAGDRRCARVNDNGVNRAYVFFAAGMVVVGVTFGYLYLGTEKVDAKVNIHIEKFNELDKNQVEIKTVLKQQVKLTSEILEIMKGK